MKQETIVQQATIETPRFVLRPLRTSDVGLITLYAADARVAAMTTIIPHPLPPGVIESFIARSHKPNRTDHVWAMDASAHGGAELMGTIALTELSRNQSEIGFWVAPPMWNSGLGTEAVKALVKANPLNNDVMFASVFQDNPQSARVLTNARFNYLGDAEAFCVARNATIATWTYSRKFS